MARGTRLSIAARARDVRCLAGTQATARAELDEVAQVGHGAHGPTTEVGRARTRGWEARACSAHTREPSLALGRQGRKLTGQGKVSAEAQGWRQRCRVCRVHGAD